MKKLILPLIMLLIGHTAYSQCSSIIDLNTWIQEGPPASGAWTVNAAGTSLTQTINGMPTFFVSPQDFINVRISGTIRVNTTGDDDLVGFVFGWQPIGNTGPSYNVNSLLFDWKQGNQTWSGNTSLEGRHLSQFTNFPSDLATVPGTGTSFWGHVNQPGYQLLAAQTGTQYGWLDNTDYDFTLTYLSNRTVIEIDNDTVFDINGCFQPGRFGFYNFSQSAVIYSNFAYELIPDFNPVTNNVCLNDSAHFQFTADTCANPNQLNFPVSTWAWDFGDGNTSTDINPAHLYGAPGNYTVQLVITDPIGCADSTTRVITIDPVPTQPVVGNNTPICNGDQINLTAGAVGGVTYNWTGPGGYVSSAQNPIIFGASPAASGNYVCTLSNGSCPGLPDSTAVVVHPTPAALTPGSNSPICSDSVLMLTANAVPGATYTWTGPNGFTSSAQNPTRTNMTLAEAGSYSVFATVNGCPGPVSSTAVTVAATPIAAIAGDTNICDGSSTTLTASGGSTYAWNTTQSTPGITVTPALGSTAYSVVATDVNGCPSLPVSRTVIVNALPVPDIGPDTASCDSFLLDAGPGYLNYQWSTGATSQTLMVYVSAQVWVEVMNTDSCSARDTANITINYPAAVSLGPDQSKCAWNDVTLTPLPSGFSSYLWNTTGTASSLTVNAPGTYWVTVETAAGCASSDTIDVFNYALLSGDVGNDTTDCSGNTLTLNASSWGGGSYTWNPGATSGPTYPVTVTGQYSVIIDDGNGCLFYDTINVVMDNPPAPSLVVNPTDLCAGEQVIFTASPNTLPTYIFSINGVNQPSAAANTFTVANAQSPLSATVTGITTLGCTTSISLPASPNIVPRPTGTVTTTTVCEGGTSALNLSPAPVGSTVTWSGDDGLSGSGANITYNFPSGAGVYNWSVNIDNGLCDTTITGSVAVTGLPAAPTVRNDSVCPGEPGRLSCVQPGGTYQWFSNSTGGSSLFTGARMDLFGHTSNFSCYVQTTVNGCTSPRTLATLTVNPAPTADFMSTPDPGVELFLPNTQVDFINLSSGNLTNSWDFGDFNTSTQVNPSHAYTEAGLYTVTLIVTSDEGCKDTLAKGEYPVTDLRGFFIANAFTPNDDGLNDVFEIVHPGYPEYEINIFDRWGSLLFTNGGDTQLFWDGKSKGQPVPQGVYVYAVNMTDWEGNKSTRKGSITIIR